MKPVRAGGVVLRISLFCFVTPFVASILYAALTLFGIAEGALLPFVPVLILAVYVVFRKKLIPAVAWVNGGILLNMILLLSFLMWANDGSLGGMTSIFGFASFPLYLGLLLLLIMGETAWAYLMVITCCFLAFWASVILQDETRRWSAKILKIGLILTLVTAVLGGLDYYLYHNRPEVKYAGHGFSYMHGWSSTDFTDYTVYSENSKLATLDHPASLTIEDPDEMPVMDGAEACYPVYAAIAKAVYKDIDQIEKDFVTKGAGADGGSQAWLNGRIVTFTNTIMGFERLIQRGIKGAPKADLFFGARPSKSQMEEAKEWNTEVTITPIGKEAFVFFVEPDNPVTDISSEDIRKIYHGDITNWKELGGKNQKILAFQRPEDSGSQTMMQYFMGDVTLKEPKTYETVDSMEGVVKHVAQYNNEKGALGYSFRYFVEDLNQENDVRLLSIDGVAPTIENIKNGTYPLTVDLCLITREGDENPNVQKMIDYCLSEEGQEIIEKTGYAGLGK